MIEIDCYRYEDEEGAGPFFKLDGTNKRGGRNVPADDIRCACDSIENLIKWFKHYGPSIDPAGHGYKIVHYKVRISDNMYNKENGHIEFDSKKEVIHKYDN